LEFPRGFNSNRMTAKDFDKIEPCFKVINDKIPWGPWIYDVLNFSLPKYHRLINSHNVLLSGGSWKIAGISKTSNIDSVYNELVGVKSKIFKFLDSVENPYMYLLSPIYEYGSGYDYKNSIGGTSGYKKNRYSGLVNLDLSIEYAKQRLLKT